MEPQVKPDSVEQDLPGDSESEHGPDREGPGQDESSAEEFVQVSMTTSNDDSGESEAESETDSSCSASEQEEPPPESAESTECVKLVQSILNEGEAEAKEFYTESMNKLLENLKGAFREEDITKFHSKLSENILNAFHESVKPIEDRGNENVRSILSTKENELAKALKSLLYTYLRKHEMHVNQMVEHLKILAFATEAKYDEAMEIFNEVQQNTEEEIRDFHELCTAKLSLWFEEMLEEYGLCPDEPTFKFEIAEMFNQKFQELSSYVNTTESTDPFSRQIEEEDIDLDADEKVVTENTKPSEEERLKICLIL